MPVSGHTSGSAYVLANCWSTLDASSCRLCLENASNSLLRCLPWSEGRTLNIRCFTRYSDVNFMNQLPSDGSSRGGAIIGAFICKNRTIEKKRKGSYSLNFEYSKLEKATGGFREANKLGQGGFGIVYKGALPDGRDIAVKRVFFNNRDGMQDFYNEVNIISSIEHKKSRQILGCSTSGHENLLVFEFLPKRSLDQFIFGTAEGLAYLHENTAIRITHRDIKASNILLDSRSRAKIADFGHARSFQTDKTHLVQQLLEH